MYELKNGILYKDGKAEFTVGTSYFASFNKDKYPVPPGEARFPEAVKDIKEISDFGFNVVRVAAFEDVTPSGEEYDISMPFINHMVQEIEKNNMASIVRLQGYTMNIKNRDDAVLCTVDGDELDKNDVSVFIYDNFFNDNLVEDAKSATKALAKYFDKNSVVGYQVYNEPWLSGKPFSPLGYGKWAEKAYKEYLVENGLNAESFEPLKNFSQENIDEWIKYRLFVTKKFMEYLGILNNAGKSTVEKMESETNFTGCPTWHSCAHFSVDYFKAAKELDYLGLDIYDPLKGGYFHFIKALMAMVESAAYLEGKNAHILEFCCRTHMDEADFERQLSVAVATGYKGVNFYAWRSDVSGPEGGLGGIIYHDRKKTPKYDEAKKAIETVKKIGNEIVCASKLREGVAIFESEYARHYSDLTQKSLLTSINRAVYEDIYNEGFSPDYVDASHLINNNLDIEVLFVADYSIISDEEKEIISEFAKTHYVFRYEVGVGYVMHNNCVGDITNEKMLTNFCWKIGTKGGLADWRFKIYEVFEMMHKKPMVHTKERAVDLGCLVADEYIIVAITNTHSIKKSIDAFEIKIDKALGEFKTAVLYSKDGEENCKINGEIINVPGIKTAGYLLLKK